MVMPLVGKQRVAPKAKDPFTMLFVNHPKPGVEGVCAEGIYVPDSFPLPALAVGAMVDVQWDSGGFLLSVSEAGQAAAFKLNKA